MEPSYTIFYIQKVPATKSPPGSSAFDDIAATHITYLKASFF
jgi:hypothetical protein